MSPGTVMHKDCIESGCQNKNCTTYCRRAVKMRAEKVMVAVQDNGRTAYFEGPPVNQELVDMNAAMQLKVFNPDIPSNSVEDMMLMLALSGLLLNSYKQLGITPPPWLQQRDEQLRTAIMRRARGEIEEQIRAIEAEEELLKSNEDKRKDLAARKLALKEQLLKELPSR